MVRIGALFILVPLLELVLLFRVGQWIGVGPTLLLVAGTGVLGAYLARREGLRALIAVQTELARGRLPTRPLFDGASVLVGGALLMTPGIVTDLAGFCLLLPLTRRLIQRWVRWSLARAVARGAVRVQVWGVGVRGGPTPEERGSTPGPARPGPGLGADRGSERDLGARGSQGRPPRPGEIIQD